MQYTENGKYNKRNWKGKLCEVATAFDYKNCQVIRCENIATHIWFYKKNWLNIEIPQYDNLGLPVCEDCLSKLKGA